MAEHPHVALAERAWQAVAHSDIEGLRDIFADEVVWHATGRNPWAGDHRGFEAILDYLADVGDRTDEFDARLDDVLVSPERILMIFHAAAQVGDRKLDVDYMLLARVSNGRVGEVWTSPMDPAAIDLFWGLN